MEISKVVEKTYEILKGVASRKGIISYGELYDQIGVDMKNASERKRGAGILNDVNEFSVFENDIMISALVVKNDTQFPGEEFFRQAASYEPSLEEAGDEEKKDFWKKETTKIYEAYS